MIFATKSAAYPSNHRTSRVRSAVRTRGIYRAAFRAGRGTIEVEKQAYHHSNTECLGSPVTPANAARAA